MKVALVGGAKGTQMKAPFDDPEWQVWALGNQLRAYDTDKIDVVFEIHDDLSKSKPDYPDWLVKTAKKLIVGENFPIQADHVHVYPFDYANRLLGGHLSSSPAYMMAYALLNKDVTDIGLWGYDMAVDDHEYFKQRPDMYGWIGYARGKGINVLIPEESAMFQSTYDEGKDWGNSGIDYGNAPFTVSAFTELVTKHKLAIKECREKEATLKREADTHNGVMQAYDHMRKVARAIESGATVNNLLDVTKD